VHTNYLRLRVGQIPPDMDVSVLFNILQTYFHHIRDLRLVDARDVFVEAILEVPSPGFPDPNFQMEIPLVGFMGGYIPPLTVRLENRLAPPVMAASVGVAPGCY
jgi:hypothetical protein